MTYSSLRRCVSHGTVLGCRANGPRLDRDEAGLESAFDLILLDIELPGIKGDAICQQLHAAGVQTPMIALTASAMPDQIESFHAAGFDEVITNPVDTQKLRELARRYDQARARTPEPAR